MFSDDDTGDWAPDSLLVVHLELGLPSPAYEPAILEEWFQVDKIIQTKYRYKIYNESMNAGVLAFYNR